jgi:hypothetical protein
MQCACSRNSTLFKVVPLLELKTRGDAGYQEKINNVAFTTTSAHRKPYALECLWPR